MLLLDTVTEKAKKSALQCTWWLPQTTHPHKGAILLRKHWCKSRHLNQFKAYIYMCMYKLLIWCDVYLLSGFTYQAQCSFLLWNSASVFIFVALCNTLNFSFELFYGLAHTSLNHSCAWKQNFSWKVDPFNLLRWNWPSTFFKHISAAFM